MNDLAKFAEVYRFVTVTYKIMSQVNQTASVVLDSVLVWSNKLN